MAELKEAGVETAPNAHGKFVSRFARGADMASLMAAHFAEIAEPEPPEADTDMALADPEETEADTDMVLADPEETEATEIADEDDDIVFDDVEADTPEADIEISGYDEFDEYPGSEDSALSGAEIAAMLLAAAAEPKD